MKKATKRAAKKPTRKPLRKKPAPSPLAPSPLGAIAEDPPSRVPPELLAQLDRAVQTGRYLVAIYRIEGGLIHMDRTKRDFPENDHDRALDLLRKNLQKK